MVIRKEWELGAGSAVAAGTAVRWRGEGWRTQKGRDTIGTSVYVVLVGCDRPRGRPEGGGSQGRVAAGTAGCDGTGSGLADPKRAGYKGHEAHQGAGSAAGSRECWEGSQIGKWHSRRSTRCERLKKVPEGGNSRLPHPPRLDGRKGEREGRSGGGGSGVTLSAKISHIANAMASPVDAFKVHEHGGGGGKLPFWAGRDSTATRQPAAGSSERPSARKGITQKPGMGETIQNTNLFGCTTRAIWDVLGARNLLRGSLGAFATAIDSKGHDKYLLDLIFGNYHWLNTATWAEDDAGDAGDADSEAAFEMAVDSDAAVIYGDDTDNVVMGGRHSRSSSISSGYDLHVPTSGSEHEDDEAVMVCPFMVTRDRKQALY
ncbi:hypothetical protein B0H10DRAFT_2297127 [Mycena sp. CBHHK59/15]|nr:hypothetical protein B0H10DRAFT_2297127 [Mycena sp. CBHHK59/15]